MSVLRPDESSARELAGLEAGAPRPPSWDPVTGDGTLTNDPATRAPLVLGNRDFHSVTETVCGYIEKGPGRWWLPAFILSAKVAGLMPIMIGYL
ncbi:MAG: hypothetical protein MUE97_07900, partial [Phycisphaerales bacterium]|nr:hypothetical protein [Phycisphaerales bacterium]